MRQGAPLESVPYFVTRPLLFASYEAVTSAAQEASCVDACTAAFPSLLWSDVDVVDELVMLNTLQNSAPLSGTGARFQAWVIILAGVAALAASLLTMVSVWLQTKNYRKPLLQRYVVRILLMVPIYSISSWVSLYSLRAAFWIDPFVDVYEAFTIYAFFQLLINFVGGERALIIMMQGRPPVSHPWPLSRCCNKVDISDPHTFLAIKRGILQYTWVKPILAIATIIMKATGVYKGGYTSADSGYFWSGLIYNVSITVSLYALAMFWVCMSTDLRPFRPMPKFLCIKGIIFASYWQGFLLSILVYLGAFPNSIPEYSPENLGAAIQDALICFEMPLFAVAHWYAFSWHDYADVTISAARMPVKFALRDAFGPRDLIEDAKDTFAGKNYEYRYFDAAEDVIAHEDSAQRKARMSQGMRYARGGKGKYWIPQPGGPSSRTPLLRHSSDDESGSVSPTPRNGESSDGYGTTGASTAEPTLDAEDERIFSKARNLEFGDWNYPVITAHHASREDRLYRQPNVLTASTNRNIIQPTQDNKRRRKSRIESIQNSADKGKHRTPSSHSQQEPDSLIHNRLRQALHLPKSSSTEPAKSDKGQLVDLVVEDDEADEAERVRARKSGNPAWNNVTPKHLVQAYPDEQEPSEVVRGNVQPGTQPPSKDTYSDSNIDHNGTDDTNAWPASVRGKQEATPAKHDAHVKYDDLDESDIWNSPKG